MKKLLKTTIPALAFCILFWGTLVRLNAQGYNTLYWMQGIPQSSYANPALQPNPNYYVGIPGISALSLGVSNTGFAPSDILDLDRDGNLFVNEIKFLDAIKDNNQIIMDVSNDLIAFGFRAKQKNYFSFNLTERIENRFGIAGDLFRIAIQGNDPFMQEGIAAHLNGLSVNFTHFREAGFGYSRNINSKFTVGARAKVLQGMGNINFERSEISLYTDSNNYEMLLSANMMINTTLPFSLAPLEDFDPGTVKLTTDELINYVSNSGNLGFAMDIGGVYDINDQFSVAASARDLGFINWKSGTENISLKGEFEFKGIDFNDFFSGDDDEGNNNQEEDDSPVGAIIDSIIDLFERVETANAYSLMLNPKFYLSAAYNLTTMHKFAVLGRGEIFNGELYPSFTVSYNFQPINRFGSSLSYSIIHGNYHNVGFGVHINIFPLQIYMVTDNFFWGMQPHTLQNMSLQVGVNIAAGFNRGKKADLTAPRFRW